MRNPENIQAIFNRIAPVYDQLNDWLSLGQHRVWKLMAVKWCEPGPGMSGLDLCCGSGDLTLLLAREIGPEGQVWGLDFSAAQLAIARNRIPSYHSAALTWVEGDALNLPFADNTFDCLTMGYGLRNLTDIPRSFQELYRVLKPGAKGAILDFNHPSDCLTASFQKWYLQNLVVPVARYFNLTEEYAYIMPSLAQFPPGPQQVKLAQEAGFAQATHYAISGGMMGVLVLTK